VVVLSIFTGLAYGIQWNGRPELTSAVPAANTSRSPNGDVPHKEVIDMQWHCGLISLLSLIGFELAAPRSACGRRTTPAWPGAPFPIRERMAIPRP
jgi:hypothetical protein